MPPATETRKIIVKVDTSDSKGLREIADQMGALNKTTKQLAGGFNFLSGAFKAWIGFFSTREIANMSDQFQNLEQRLRIVAHAGDDSAVTMQSILDLAQRTKLPVQQVGDSFLHLSEALKSAKPNANEIISLQETLIDTFKVSQVSASESASSMDALARAFARGQIQGRDLKTILGDNVYLIDALKKKFGGDLATKAQAGIIKLSDFMKVLATVQEDVKKKADQLPPTFGETMTRALNQATFAFGELNKEMGLSAKFAVSVGFVMDNMTTILKGVAVVVTVIAISRIPAMIESIKNLALAARAFAVSNPILAILTALVVVAELVYFNFDKLKLLFLEFELAVDKIALAIDEKLAPVLTRMAGVLGKDFKEGFGKGLQDNIEKSKKNIVDLMKEIDNLRKQQEKQEKQKKANPNGNLDSLIPKIKDEPHAQKIKDILGELNKELIAGKINLDQYNDKLVNFELYKLNREFKEGKFDVFTYNQRLKELNIQEFNRELKNGYISLAQYNASVERVNIKELNEQFKAGKIPLTEYHEKLVKISQELLPTSALVTGTNDYIKSIGTLSDNIAKGITSTFTHLEDTLVDFVKTGEFNFAKFTQAVLDDLTRIIIRAAILRPLANGILGAITGGGGGNVGPDAGAADTGAYNNVSSVSAKGNAFYQGNLVKFAKGGVVTGPTLFGYKGGRGLMGEAGTEAIMPLKRASNGDLGVAASAAVVNVNIINQTGAQVQQTESTGPNGEKSIDVLITSKVASGIATGKFDQAFKQSFNLSRKGS